jgi:hypothetical protein
MMHRLSAFILAAAPAFAVAQAPAKWRLVEQWRKGGEVEGPHAFDAMLNAGATALAPSPGGRLVVLDASKSTIHILDSTGAAVRSFARNGGGPGEFRNALGIAVGHDGRIVVNDLSNARYVMFAPNGDFDRVVQISRRYLFSFDIAWDASFDANGQLLESVSIPPKSAAAVRAPGMFGDSTLMTERWTADFARSDSSSLCGTPVPMAQDHSTRYVKTTPGSPALRENTGGRPPGGMITWIPVPFTEQLQRFVRDRNGFEWAPISPGSGELVRRRSGQCGSVLARITLRGPRTPVPESMRDSALRRVPDDVRERVPRDYPWFRALRVDDQNRLWVERDVSGGRRFDVFASSGQAVAEVDVPSSLASDLPVVIAHGRVYGFVKDSDDVPYLVAWRIRTR